MASLRPDERLRAWLVSGPVGRLAALTLELGVALANLLRRRR